MAVLLASAGVFFFKRGDVSPEAPIRDPVGEPPRRGGNGFQDPHQRSSKCGAPLRLDLEAVGGCYRSRGLARAHLRARDDRLHGKRLQRLGRSQSLSPALGVETDADAAEKPPFDVPVGESVPDQDEAKDVLAHGRQSGNRSLPSSSVSCTRFLPLRSTRKISHCSLAPRSRLEEKAIVRPSGENAGS